MEKEQFILDFIESPEKYYLEDDSRITSPTLLFLLFVLCLLLSFFKNYLRGFLIAACAAARRAIGTLNGEHET